MQEGTLEIRLMTKEDLDQVMAIEMDSFSVPWRRDDFLEGLGKEACIYVVAVLEKEIVGYCGLWSVIDEGEINNVAVKKDFRGRKIGETMLKELIRLGKEKGLIAFTLEVRTSNQSAIALYHKLGFTDAGIRKDYYVSPREDAIIMWYYVH